MEDTEDTEVMEDTLTPLFQVDPCTMAPTIPTAQTGELGPRTTTPTEGKYLFKRDLYDKVAYRLIHLTPERLDI